MYRGYQTKLVQITNKTEFVFSVTLSSFLSHTALSISFKPTWPVSTGGGLGRHMKQSMLHVCRLESCPAPHSKNEPASRGVPK